MRNMCPSFFNGFWCLYTVFKKNYPKQPPNTLSSIYGILYQLLTSSPDDDASSDSQCLARWHKSLEVDPNKRVTSAMDPRSSLRNRQFFSSRFLSMPFQKDKDGFQKFPDLVWFYEIIYWDEISPFPSEKKGNQGRSCQKKRKDLGSGQWLVNHQPHSITIV